MAQKKKAATTKRTVTKPYLVISRKGRGRWRDVGWYSTWRAAEKTAPRWDLQDMRHIAETGMRFVKSGASKEEQDALSKITIETGNHPGLRNSLFLKYDVKNGPKGYVSVQQAGYNQKTDLGRAMRPGYFYVQAYQRYKGQIDMMIEGDYDDAAPVALIAADILRKVIRTELARRPTQKKTEPAKKKSSFLR